MTDSADIVKPGETLVRRPSGAVDAIPDEFVAQAKAEGDVPLSLAETIETARHAGAGGLAGTVSALSAGAARTATFGGSDVLATSLAGDDAGLAREGLAQFKEQHPVASLAGETAGMFLTPGLGAAGKGAAGLATRLAGEGATTIGRRAWQAGTRYAAQGAAEMALLDAGEGVSEEALGDPEANGEKLLAYAMAAGRGAGRGLLTGAAIGSIAGGLGGSVKAAMLRGRPASVAATVATGAATKTEGVGLAEATEALDRQSSQTGDWLRGSAEDSAFRSYGFDRGAVGRLGEDPKAVHAAERRLGRIGIDHGIVTPTASKQQISERALSLTDKVGEELGAMRDQLDASGARFDPMPVVRRGRALVSELRSALGKEAEAGAVEKIVDEFETKMGAERPAPPKMAKVPGAFIPTEPKLPRALDKEMGAIIDARLKEAVEAHPRYQRVPGEFVPTEPILPKVPAPITRKQFERIIKEKYPKLGVREGKAYFGKTLDDLLNDANAARLAGHTDEVANALLAHESETTAARAAHEANVQRITSGNEALARAMKQADYARMAARSTEVADALAAHEAEQSLAKQAHDAKVADTIKKNDEAWAAYERARDTVPMQKFERAHGFRRDLDDGRLKWDTASAPGTVQQLRRFRSILEDEFEQQADKAAERMGRDDFLRDYKTKKALFADLSRIKDASSKASMRDATGSPIRLSSIAGGVVGGSIRGIPGAFLGAAFTKAVRTYGNQIAATAFDRASGLNVLSNGIGAADKAIASGINKIANGGVSAGKADRLTHDQAARIAEEVKVMANDQIGLQGHIRRTIGRVHEAAPSTATAMAITTAKAISYLAATAPVPKTSTPSLTPFAEAPRYAPKQLEEWAERLAAVEDPIAVLDEVNSGRLSRAKIETLREVYPKLYQEMQQKVALKVAGSTKPLSWERQKALAIFLGIPTSPLLTPGFIGAMQATKAPAAKPSGGSDAPRQAQALSRVQVNPTMYQTPSERIAAR